MYNNNDNNNNCILPIEKRRAMPLQKRNRIFLGNSMHNVYA